MNAAVFTVVTLTTPERLTDAEPEKPAAIPIPAMSSLLVAVTATPRNGVGSDGLSIVRGPKELGSAAGSEPDSTMVCERPVPTELKTIAGPPFSLESLSVFAPDATKIGRAHV